MTTIAAHVEHQGYAPEHGGLVAAVREWRWLQVTRVKLTLPIRAAERGGYAAPEWAEEMIEELDELERESAKLIQREWRDHPLAEWAETVRGLGAHSCAIVVALLGGDPLVAYPMQRVGPRKSSRVEYLAPYDRSLSQLWSYAGLGDSSRTKREGMSQSDLLALGKPLLKSRVRLIAEAFVKAGNERYREVYDAARVEYRERVHATACPPCHAKEGDPWRPGHQHAAALRKVGKVWLADLYDAAKEAR
jgi:hypothetical protein